MHGICSKMRFVAAAVGMSVAIVGTASGAGADLTAPPPLPSLSPTATPYPVQGGHGADGCRATLTHLKARQQALKTNYWLDAETTVTCTSFPRTVTARFVVIDDKVTTNDVVVVDMQYDATTAIDNATPVNKTVYRRWPAVNGYPLKVTAANSVVTGFGIYGAPYVCPKAGTTRNLYFLVSLRVHRDTGGDAWSKWNRTNVSFNCP
jgi:hypothetical protein